MSEEMSASEIQRWVNRRYGHVSATLADGRIFVCGGRYHPDPWNEYNKEPLTLDWVGIYNPMDFTWRRLKTTGDIPRPGTHSTTAQVVGDDMFVFCHDGDNDYAPDSEEEGYEGEKDRCDVYALHVKTLVWRKMAVKSEGGGEETRPIWGRSQVSWIRGGDSIVVLGHIFRPPDDEDDDEDDDHDEYEGEVQLAVYKTKENVWWWPKCTGEIPDPQVGFGVGDSTAYVFGHVGRYDQPNCVYRLDEQWKWEMLPELSEKSPLQGTSLTLLSPPSCSRSIKALLCGSSDNWTLDISGDNVVRWTHNPHLDKQSDCRVGHAAALEVTSGQVLLIGGEKYEKEHGYEGEFHSWVTMAVLTVSPLPLQILAMEVARKEVEKLQMKKALKVKEWAELENKKNQLQWEMAQLEEEIKPLQLKMAKLEEEEKMLTEKKEDAAAKMEAVVRKEASLRGRMEELLPQQVMKSFNGYIMTRRQKSWEKVNMEF